MKILLTGANGQIGWELARRGAHHGMEILACDRLKLDITDKSAVNRAIKQVGVSLVINAAAYTAVDKAEDNPELARAVNQKGPANLAGACTQARIPLIHLSTDYVFDGKKSGPYFETDPVSPLGVYGESKLAGEEAIRKTLPTHIILRTAWLYGVHGHNFVKTMLRLGKERKVLRVVDDQYGCPTYAADLAEAILIVAAHILKRQQTKWGTYHYCGKGVTSWHGFAEAILDIARQYDSFVCTTVDPITTVQWPSAVMRPQNSVLDCSKITETFGIHPKPWTQSLASMLSEHYETI